MTNSNLLSVFFIIILSIAISPILLEQSNAQGNPNTSIRYQWKQFADPDTLTCKEDQILIQKTSGIPACVSSSSYLKLVDRGYGKFDSSQLMKRSDMMANLMGAMIDEPQLMHHWHNMMLKDPIILESTKSNTILQLRENQEYVKNLLEPMITNQELREQMIGQMKNHTQMMTSLQEHSGWMDSVHQPMSGSSMGKGMNSEMHGTSKCLGCSDMQSHNIHSQKGFHQAKLMEDLMHHIWINEKMRTQMNNSMLENPIHMDLMANQMMNPLLGIMMDNQDLRNQMIDLLIENQEFMDSIRHENNLSN